MLARFGLPWIAAECPGRSLKVAALPCHRLAPDGDELAAEDRGCACWKIPRRELRSLIAHSHTILDIVSAATMLVSVETSKPDSGNSTRDGASPLSAHLGFWLRFLSNHVSSRFEELLATEGVSVTEWMALRTLFDRVEMSHAELIGALTVTKGAASKIISRLENKGLAQRSLAKGSQRDQAVSLTDAGRQLVPELARIADENDAHFFAHLSLFENKALRELLERLVRHHQLQTLPTE